MLTKEEIIEKLDIKGLDPEFQDAVIKTYRKNNIKSIQQVRKEVRTEIVINIIREADYSKLEMEELAVKCCNVSSARFRKLFRKEKLKKQMVESNDLNSQEPSDKIYNK